VPSAKALFFAGLINFEKLKAVAVRRLWLTTGRQIVAAFVSRLCCGIDRQSAGRFIQAEQFLQLIYH